VCGGRRTGLTLGALRAEDEGLADVGEQDPPGLAGPGPAAALRAGEVEGDWLGLGHYGRASPRAKRPRDSPLTFTASFAQEPVAAH
jgi:hypothetical protein